jgi:hypothetical protein
MFVDNARAYPSEIPFQVLHSRVGFWPYPFINYEEKSVVDNPRSLKQSIPLTSQSNMRLG